MPVDARHTSLADYIRFESPDLFTKVDRFQEWLADWHERDLHKYLHQYVSFNGGSAQVRDSRSGDVHDVQVYCSADYLDMARHPGVIAAARDALGRFGASVSSVPLIAGSTTLHAELEHEIATFLGVESCVLFPTGQAANVSTIAALCSASDAVVIDKQVHYSVLEGVKLAGCHWRSFRHSDPEHLNLVLRTVRERRPRSGILVIVEGVYGLDGDVGPYPDMISVAKRHQARVMLDDAHATGVLGPRGAGTADFFNLKAPADIVMGSLGKALGSVGGLIGAPRHVTEYLRYFAKTISFSIGLAPSSVAAALHALRLIQGEGGLISRLRSRHARLRDSLLDAGFADVSRSQSAIMSIVVGSEAAVKESTRDLFNAGVWVEGLPFPAVSRGQERLRFRARASHTDEQIDRATEIVRRVATKYGYLERRVAVAGSFSGVTGGKENSGELLELIYKAAALRSLPPSWFSPEWKRKIVEKSGFWEEASFDQAWFRSGTAPIGAAVCASIAREGDKVVGGLGQCAWLPGQDDALVRCLSEGVDWLRRAGVGEVFAPLQLPMQILGAGLPAGSSLPDSRPFLETTNDAQLNVLLPRLGFQPAWRNRYLKLDLSDPVRVTHRPSQGVVYRDLERWHLEAEIAQLTPLLNETVCSLPYCSQIHERVLYGIASELRDLILPGFWRLAFDKERLIGFVASFPNITEAVAQACGMADVADLVNVSDALDRVDEGFVAWMGVSPSVEGKEVVAAELLDQVFVAMRLRGFKRTWLSWELHNGDGRVAERDFAPHQVVDRLDYQVYGLGG